MPRSRRYVYDWEGPELKVGIHRFKIKKQLSKWVDDVLAQRHVLTLAQYVKEDISVMLTQEEQTQWMPYPGGGTYISQF